MLRQFLVLCFLCFSGTVLCQPVLISKSAEITFFSEAPVENISAKNNSVNSIVNTTTGDIAFIISIRGFKFEKELMQEHFNEKYLESDKYPQATFKGRINDSLDWNKDGIYEVTATGIMSIHGIDKTVTEKASIEIKGKDVHLSGKLLIAIADYTISIPKLLFQNIADTINVELKSDYIPYKKKD
ncbi:MAG: YceI family protein [Bacteroidetes bacterium]|nr:YceI family protein [Bacteroidota bacterium]